MEIHLRKGRFIRPQNDIFPTINENISAILSLGTHPYWTVAKFNLFMHVKRVKKYMHMPTFSSVVVDGRDMAH